jgi:MFS family permease
MVTAGNQSTGIQFCTNYNSVLFASLGYTGAGPLYLQAGWLMTAMASDIFWAAWLDKIGRRPLILCQPLACACNMAIIVGLYATYAGTTNLAGLRALCAMVYLFVFVYSMDEPAEYVFIAEIFPTHVRTKGIALGTASIMLTSVWLTMSAPIGMATIGWKYFLILCLLGVVYFFAQWKFIKESKFPPYNPCSGRPRRIFDVLRHVLIVH